MKVDLEDVMNFLGYEIRKTEWHRKIYKTEKGEISIIDFVLFDNFDDLKHGTKPIDLIIYLKDCSRPQAQGILNKIYKYKEVKNENQ